MSSSRLPAVRLGPLSEEDPAFDEMKVDFQPSSGSKFAIAWPGSPTQDVQKRPDQFPRHESHHGHPTINSESASEEDATPTNNLSQEETSAPLAGPSSTSQDANSHLEFPPAPRLSRAFSMPLPSQLGHWQHPGRSGSNSGTPTTPDVDMYSTTAKQQFQELALELADSVQTAVQTLLQLSPPHLFDPAKEQFSACAVQIPTPSISALLTSMKNLNYISANINRFGPPSHQGGLSLDSDEDVSPGSPSKDEFDIGELLQSVGDSLSGVAAETGVDLVLHHGDAIKHMGVRGDECGISYALSHIIHQTLMTTKPGDSVEIGLFITGQPRTEDGSDHPPISSSSSRSSPSAGSPVLDDGGPVVCTFDVAHRFGSSLDAASSEDLNDEPQPSETDSETQPCHEERRPEPQFSTTILHRLLRYIGGTVRTSLQPRLFPRGRRCELAILLERGPSLADLHQRTPPAEEEVSRMPFPNVRLAREPSIEELTTFAETLRGKRVAFHASSQGSFAHHLTRYLTAWGMDISHVPTDGQEERDPAEDIPSTHMKSEYGSLASSPGLGIGSPAPDNVPPIVDSASDTPSENKSTSGGISLSFVIIDDDVLVLRRRLLQYRAEAVPNLHLHPRKRPSLTPHHRPRSSPSIRNALLAAGTQQQPSSSPALPPVPIVHFTSLANYKLVKDALQAVLLLPGSSPFLPEVIVMPKPAGPRRLLTALYTAVHKPIVDPFFSPIATSPMSPSGTFSPFFTARKSAGNTPPSGFRPERPARTGSDSTSTLPPTSPLAIPEGLEYFSDAAVKKLGGNAASGLVIQSPDGRPAGIFFQPQSRTSSSRSDLATTTTERDRTPFRPANQRTSRRSSTRKSIEGTNDSAEANKEEPSRLASPTTNSSPLIPTVKLSPTSATPSRLERPRLSDQTDLLRSYKGKGRVATASPTQEEPHQLSSAAWREATKNLAKQPLTPVTPLELNPASAVDVSVAQSPTTEPSPLTPARKTNQPGNSSSTSRTPTSPPSPETKKSVARRATQRPKSPVVSTIMKKTKTVGSNIVPPISVLIVEDNAINQTILSTFMRRNRIKYEVAWNGREAVEKWRSGNFHLILMDIQMPVMDGIEATKEIRRLEKAENISHFPPSPGESSRLSPETPDSRPSSAASTPFRSQVIIVALTASSLQSDRVAALAAGCNDFLTKPVTNSWLNDKIIEWGSIKALQMWAELRPEVAKSISHDQVTQAQAVASRLHVPPGSARSSPSGSPLRGARLPLDENSDSRAVREVEGMENTFRRMRTAGARTTRRSSDKESSSSDSSPERWPMSSDDDTIQDPITEPPAVIETPVRLTIELPEIESVPTEITGEVALLNYLEESKQGSHSKPPERSTLLGQRGIVSASSATSIASVLHDTPGIGGTNTDGPTVLESTPGSVGGDASENSHEPPDH